MVPIRVPKAYSHFIYNLRTHLDVVRNRIQRLSIPPEPAGERSGTAKAVTARESVPPAA